MKDKNYPLMDVSEKTTSVSYVLKMMMKFFFKKKVNEWRFGLRAAAETFEDEIDVED